MKSNRTRSQERILKLLKIQERSLSAQDIYSALRGCDQPLGLATVYRSLDALKQEGVVTVRILANGESVYSSLQQDQHHLTCVKCGTSIPINECPVHHLEHKLQKSHSFKIFYHTLEFFGLCDRCTLTQDIS
ncbi:MAG: Fur family transcriptional regulator [Cyanobacteriota bacterium]|nr:Fur family transcriptional regulator [Cyanobacteriota bacterium]